MTLFKAAIVFLLAVNTLSVLTIESLIRNYVKHKMTPKEKDSNQTNLKGTVIKND